MKGISGKESAKKESQHLEIMVVFDHWQAPPGSSEYSVHLETDEPLFPRIYIQKSWIDEPAQAIERAKNKFDNIQSYFRSGRCHLGEFEKVYNSFSAVPLFVGEFTEEQKEYLARKTAEELDTYVFSVSEDLLKRFSTEKRTVELHCVGGSSSREFTIVPPPESSFFQIQETQYEEASANDEIIIQNPEEL